MKTFVSRMDAKKVFQTFTVCKMYTCLSVFRKGMKMTYLDLLMHVFAFLTVKSFAFALSRSRCFVLSWEIAITWNDVT
jgi:hypothetical protein